MVLWMIAFCTGVVVGAIQSARLRWNLRGVLWTIGWTFLAIALEVGVYGEITSNHEFPILYAAVVSAFCYGPYFFVLCSPPAIAGAALGLWLGQQFYAGSRRNEEEREQKQNEDQVLGKEISSEPEHEGNIHPQELTPGGDGCPQSKANR